VTSLSDFARYCAWREDEQLLAPYKQEVARSSRAPPILAGPAF
jgi:hypothetical protein